MADAAAPDPGATSTADGGAPPEGDDGGSFYEEIGYNKILDVCDETSADEQLLERIRSLKEARGDCESLEASVRALEAELARAREQTRASIEEDSANQREVDERMNAIRETEEETKRLRDAIAGEKQLLVSLAREIDGLKASIDKGSGWSKEQAKEREALVDALAECQRENDDANERLARLKETANTHENDARRSEDKRDECARRIEELNREKDTIDANMHSLQQEIKQEEGRLVSLKSALEHSTLELGDLQSRCDDEKHSIEEVMDGIEELREAQSSASKEMAMLRHEQTMVQEELDKLTAENQAATRENEEQMKMVRMLAAESDRCVRSMGNCLFRVLMNQLYHLHIPVSIKKELAHLQKMRDSVDEQARAATREREQHDKEIDSLTAQIARLEGTDIPSVAKEVDAVARKIKRKEQELDIVQRKIGVSKVSSVPRPCRLLL